MLTYYVRFLDGVTLAEGDAMTSDQALDLANYKELEIVVRVLEAGEGEEARFIVEHSASNEEGAWLSFSDPVEVDLGTTGNTWMHQSAFTRWIGWRLSGTLRSSAVVTVEILAKG